MKLSIQPRIYVACLAAYNNGFLHGVWLDADQSLSELRSCISAMLKESPIEHSEEYAIHDYEGFGDIGLGEYEGLVSVVAKADFIHTHGDLGLLVLGHCCGHLVDASNMIDRYIGEFESLADYAAGVIEDTAQVPDWLEHYLDYSAIGRDMSINGDIDVIEAGLNQVHLFWGH